MTSPVQTLCDIQSEVRLSTNASGSGKRREKMAMAATDGVFGAEGHGPVLSVPMYFRLDDKSFQNPGESKILWLLVDLARNPFCCFGS